jgi:hypothetical protein
MEQSEKYVFAYVGPDGSTTTIRSFEADDLYALAFHILEFTRQIGYEYVQDLTFSEAGGQEWRAELQ